MTPSDVLVAAPWIVFGVALAVMCTLLRRSQRRNGRQPRPLTRLPPIQTAQPARHGPAQAAARPGQRPGRAAMPAEGAGDHRLLRLAGIRMSGKELQHGADPADRQPGGGSDAAAVLARGHDAALVLVLAWAPPGGEDANRRCPSP